jgi:hypothetical protein
MTKDTKRALEIIEPIAKELNIEVSADDDYLYINNDGGIGITFNSTRATLMEFVGWLIYYYDRIFRDIKLTDEQLEIIRTFWYSQAHIEGRRKCEND